jgi:hypothetical protein
VLALIIGILLLVVGETTAEVDLTLEFERIDSLFWLIGFFDSTIADRLRMNG